MGISLLINDGDSVGGAEKSRVNKNQIDSLQSGITNKTTPVD